MKGALEKLSVRGFKSIRELKDFPLKELNVFVGANGAGKSNLIELFRMLAAMADKNFSKYILAHNGADGFLFNGPKVTTSISAEFVFKSHSSFSQGPNTYRFEATPTTDGRKFLLSEERQYVTTSPRSYGPAAEESRLWDEKDEVAMRGNFKGVGHHVYESISNWMVYHFHDTSANAPMRRYEIVEDCQRLRSDASNIAPFLSHLRKERLDSNCYKEIVNSVRLIIPFFDDFRLDVHKLGEANKVALSWQQIGSDFPMQPFHLSDGSIRFICLATALLQPWPPSMIIIDEPELGLHPEAIGILSELIQDAAKRTQIVVATQSPLLLDQFAIEDIVVVNRRNGQSTFERLERADYDQWLKEYSVGQLWTKNVIQGGTTDE
ncbi:MAG: AAA family ATPase [Gammaproteobacteria bacterium]|nr:AAA family ATPase [Gammaproteobacteria bacterium]MYE28707.1 AAA family ATPase [Gammaproteobacteria bacterium]